MNNQLRAAELLRQAAAALTNTTTSTNNPTDSDSSKPSTSVQSVQSAVRNAFAPYRQVRARGTYNMRGRAGQLAASSSYWTHRFCVLASTSQETAPIREEKLFEGGLGERKVTFPKNDSPSSFKQVLETKFPGSKNCGGYELLRSMVGSRVSLEKLKMPKNGFTTSYLAAESNLGQACCYISPIQRDVEMIQLDDKNEDEMVFEECLQCKESIPLLKLRKHIQACTQSLSSDEEDSILPKLKKRKQTPICQYMCNVHVPYFDIYNMHPILARKGENLVWLYYTDTFSAKQTFGTCPIYSKEFAKDTLAAHASNCGDEKRNEKMDMTLQEKNSLIMEQMKMEYEKQWNVKVVRRRFETTSIEQLEDGDEDDWKRPISILFIGEEGIDAGGLSRDFFSLLFKTTKVFEGNTFSVDPQLLDSKHYRLIGKVVGKAIISGHPGPRCLNHHVTQYILQGQEHDFSNIQTKEIYRADAAKAITDIEEATTENINAVFDEHIALLQATGYSKILSICNKEEAIKTLKAYFLLYRPMTSINQFVEGLKIHGLLEILQQHPKEAATFFNERSFPSADEVEAFYIPVFSKNEEEKAEEELVIYNWGKCLKNI